MSTDEEMRLRDELGAALVRENNLLAEIMDLKIRALLPEQALWEARKETLEEAAREIERLYAGRYAWHEPVAAAIRRLKDRS